MEVYYGLVRGASSPPLCCWKCLLLQEGADSSEDSCDIPTVDIEMRHQAQRLAGADQYARCLQMSCQIPAECAVDVDKDHIGLDLRHIDLQPFEFL